MSADYFTSLDDLFEGMGTMDQHTLDQHGQWRADLPTFGGEEPENTHGVWSWDAERLIVGTCPDNLRIVQRPRS